MAIEVPNSHGRDVADPPLTEVGRDVPVPRPPVEDLGVPCELSDDLWEPVILSEGGERLARGRAQTTPGLQQLDLRLEGTSVAETIEGFRAVLPALEPADAPLVGASAFDAHWLGNLWVIALSPETLSRRVSPKKKSPQCGGFESRRADSNR